MTYAIQAAAVVAAVVIVAAPGLLKKLVPARGGHSYQDALLALAVVRSRLAATGGLQEPSVAAIEALTMALVEGSDK